MREAGLQPDWVEIPPGQARKAVAQMMELLQRPDRPTAVLSGGMSLIAWAMAAAYRLGLELPRDLSTVCMESEVKDYLGLVPDHVALNFEAMGREAATMLLEQITQQKSWTKSRVIPSPVLRKYTLAPPP
jgi:LacI family transcriptional regulator